MKTPTIYDIKYLITNESHYFDRKSMRFFGQTLKDFKVKKSPQGRIFIFAPMRNNGRPCGYSLREFKDNKLYSIESEFVEYINKATNSDTAGYEKSITSIMMFICMH